MNIPLTLDDPVRVGVPPVYPPFALSMTKADTSPDMSIAAKTFSRMRRIALTAVIVNGSVAFFLSLAASLPKALRHV